MISVTKFGEILTQKNFGLLERVQFSIWQNFKMLLANFILHWANFTSLGKFYIQLKINTADTIEFQISPQLGVSEAKLVSLETFQAFQGSMVNRTDRSEAKIESVDAKFKEFAIQITDQLQRQETRATKSWVSVNNQCDQIWRNFAILAILWGFILFLA